jgi:hypothetical protein
LVGRTCRIGRAGGHKSVRGFEEIRWIWSIGSIRFKKGGVEGFLRVRAVMCNGGHCSFGAQQDGETLDVEERCAIRDKGWIRARSNCFAMGESRILGFFCECLFPKCNGRPRKSPFARSNGCGWRLA